MQSLGVRTDGRLPEQVRPLSVNVGEKAMCCSLGYLHYLQVVSLVLMDQLSFGVGTQ